MFTEKEKSILEQAEDAILRKFEEALDSSEPLSDAQFASLMEGVRVLDRVCRMKYGVYPGNGIHSDNPVGTSLICPSSKSQSAQPVM